MSHFDHLSYSHLETAIFKQLTNISDPESPRDFACLISKGIGFRASTGPCQFQDRYALEDPASRSDGNWRCICALRPTGSK